MKEELIVGKMTKIVIESEPLGWTWCVVIDKAPTGTRRAGQGITKTLPEAWEMIQAYLQTECVEPSR